MTKLLEDAVVAVRAMHPADQDIVAQAMMSLVRLGLYDDIDPQHVRDVEAGLEDVARRDFASDEEVAEAFRSFER